MVLRSAPSMAESRIPMTELPAAVIWEVTYACPLRCVHCYTDSGRRPPRQLAEPELARLVEIIREMRPRRVCVSGGEPMVVPSLARLLASLRSAGIELELSTSGWRLQAEQVAAVAPLLDEVHVSIDAPTPELNDAIRGRAGAHAQSVSAIRQFARASAANGLPTLIVLDATLVRSSFPLLETYVRDFLPTLDRIDGVVFNAASPFGYATRPGLRQDELLGEAELARLRDHAFVAGLQALAPPGVRIHATDNWELAMLPDDVARRRVRPCMFIEPDGLVRATPGYQGTVGNLLSEDPRVLWARVQQHWSHPFLVERLASVRTMTEWAEAAVAIDEHFAPPDERVRISRREPFVPLLPGAAARR